MSELKHNRMVFENAVKQTALRVARQRLHNLESGQTQNSHINRIAAITFNDWMKVKSGVEDNIFTINNSSVKYGKRQRNEYRHISSKVERYWNWATKRHWLWSTQYSKEDFDDNYDPDNELMLDYITINTEEANDDGYSEGYALTRKVTSNPVITKTLCNSTTSNITVINDNDENVQVTATAKFGKYNKSYKATYKASPPKLNADIVLCVPVNSAACNSSNDPYATEAAINDLYKTSSDYDNNAARNTPIWQIKTACRNFLRQIIGYQECGVGIVPYSGNVSIHGSDFLDNNTVAFEPYHYTDYDAVNPQVPVADSMRFGTFAINHLADSSKMNFFPDQPTYTPFLYTSSINQQIELYVNNGIINESTWLYDLVTDSSTFMRKYLDINYAGKVNVLAGYCLQPENAYPHPYPMVGITEKVSDIYRYLTTFMPFAHHTNRSNFLYLPLLFGTSMLKNNFQKSTHYNVDNGANRKKCLILIDNMGDLFAPHELTYLGMSNDASYLTLVNGEKLDFENGNLDSSNGYYHNPIFTKDKYDSSLNSGLSAGQFYNEYDEKVAIKCNYIKDSTNGNFVFKAPQPGNIKIVVETCYNKNCIAHAKIFTNNDHNSGVKVQRVTSSSGSNLETASSTYGSSTRQYYWCPVNDDDNTYTIEFENIQDRSNPVIAQLELNGCEVTGLESNDNNFVLRQDDKYVYICYENNTSSTSNTALLTLSMDDSATQHETLSYAGTYLLDSSTSLNQSGLDSGQYNFGDVYNVQLNGDFYSKFELNRTYTFPAEGTTSKTFFAGYYEDDIYEDYAQGNYGVRALVRLCFSDEGSFYANGWKNAPSDWIYGNTWSEFSGTPTTDDCISSITAEFGTAENKSLVKAPPEEKHFHQVKIYKDNGHNDVEVKKVEYVYDNNPHGWRYVIDMGEYFVAYFLWGNNFRITISNPNHRKTVYAKMEMFGTDVGTITNDKCEYRHDEDYLYMCYNGKDIIGIDSSSVENSSIDVYFADIKDDTQVKVKDTKPLSYFADCLLPATDYDSTYDSSIAAINSQIAALKSESDYTNQLESRRKELTNAKEQKSSKEEELNTLNSELSNLTNSQTNANILIDSYDSTTLYGYKVYSTSSGSVIHHIYSGYIGSDYEPETKIEFPIDCYNVYMQEGRWHIRYVDQDENTQSSYLNDPYLDKDIYPAYNYEYNQGTGKYGIRVEDAQDYTHGLILKKADSSYTIKYEPLPEIFNLYDKYAFTESFSKIKFEHRIEAKILNNEVKRKYKSKEDGVPLSIPNIVVYRKPGYYVDSNEGGDNATEYATVKSAKFYKCAGIWESSHLSNGEVDYWRFFSTGGRTYKDGVWGWDEDHKEGMNITIELEDNLPAYPVLVKFDCYDMSVLAKDSTGTEPDDHRIRQDGNSYYICSVLYNSKKLEDSAITIPTLYSVPRTGNDNDKKWKLSFANMHLLSQDGTDTRLEKSCTFTPGSTNPYTVYGHNCNINVNISNEYTYNPSWYYVNDKAPKLYTYASYIPMKYDSNYHCYYTDYFCTYNGKPERAIIDSSLASIKSVNAYIFDTKKIRTFIPSTGEHAHSITLKSSNHDYDKSYKLNSGYNVIYIPRQDNSTLTFGSDQTFDLDIGLQNTKICSIEWSNHLNGKEGCYPCDSSDGYGATYDSGKLAVYYEPLKRGKNCRWANCMSNDQENSDNPTTVPWFHDSLEVKTYDTGKTTFLWKDTTSGFDSTIYKDITGTWHLIGHSLPRSAITLITDSSTINDNATHGDFNVIINNVYGLKNVNAWFHIGGGHASEYNYMNGVGRYFQPLHEANYNAKTGKESIAFCTQISDSSNELILSSIECTNEVNRILMAIGAQTLNINDSTATGDLPDKSPSQALKDVVTPAMIEKSKSMLGDNGRIYVIHYRDSSNTWLDNVDSGYQYRANNLDELNTVLSNILQDIKQFAGSTDVQIIENE